MGGALAYIGDQLGVYWGKKRISVFGLRPKQTAVLISVITGLFITLFTLMVASILNENVEIALFNIENLKKNEEKLTKNKKLMDSSTELPVAGFGWRWCKVILLVFTVVSGSRAGRKLVVRY